MNFNNLVKGGLAAVMCMSLAACEAQTATTGSTDSGNAGNSGTETASDYVAAGDVKSYTIGTFGPTTGPYAVYGLAVTNGCQLAVKDWNEEHGTDIKVAVEDTQGDQAQAVNVYNKFISDVKVAAIIGGTVSGESIAVASASADSVKIPMISPSATAAAFTDGQDYNVFRACYTDPQQATQVADFAVDTLGAKKAAIIYNSDDDYSVGLEASFTEEFTKKGGEVVASEAFGTDDSDFSTQLTKIAAQEFDVLFVPNYYEKDVMIATQARNLGIKAQLLGCDGWDGVLDVAQANDLPNLEGAIFINQYSPDMDSVQEIMKEYDAEYGQAINSFGINSYDATMCLLEAIEAAGSLDSVAICDAIASSKHVGILGELAFDDNGDPIKTPVFVTVSGGEYVSYNK